MGLFLIADLAIRDIRYDSYSKADVVKRDTRPNHTKYMDRPNQTDCFIRYLTWKVFTLAFSQPRYYLLFEKDEKTAEEWWNKFFYRSNGYGLWKASGIFAYLGDEYHEWSMKCLRRSAWRQFKVAKMMLKDTKENSYKFPEA